MCWDDGTRWLGGVSGAGGVVVENKWTVVLGWGHYSHSSTLKESATPKECASKFLNAAHSPLLSSHTVLHTLARRPLHGFQALIDAALEMPTSALSNAVATTVWKPHSDECSACKNALEPARRIT